MGIVGQRLSWELSKIFLSDWPGHLRYPWLDVTSEQFESLSLEIGSVHGVGTQGSPPWGLYRLSSLSVAETILRNMRP